MVKTNSETNIQERVFLQYEVEQFYYREAALLDDRKFDDWLQLFTLDTHYWMPIRRTRTANELDKEFTALGAMAYFDDDHVMLGMRVKKLATGYSWAEDPPSRSRHLVNNVRIIKVDDNEIEVHSAFHQYRTRLNSEEDSWVGARNDVLRRVDGELKIAKRKILLDQTVLLARNLSTFF